MLFHCMLAPAAEITELHILVPGPKGGGWDTTARSIGETLVNQQFIESIEFTNYPGAGGWRGFEQFIKEPEYKSSIMIQSSPIIFRKVFGVYKKGYADLRPVVALLGEYEAIIIRSNSPYQSFKEIVSKIKENPQKNPIVLGSSKGSIDHVAALIILRAAGINKLVDLRFLYREGDDKAISTLLDGDGVVMFSGYGGTLLELVSKNKLTVLAISSREKVDGVEIDTLYDQGINVNFINWRGFFARKDLSDAHFALYEQVLLDLSKLTSWKKVLKKMGGYR